MTATSARSLALAAALLLAGAGCQFAPDAITTGPVAQGVAEDTARLSAGISLATVSVVSARLSTYGAERPGGRKAAPDRQVWAVVLTGAFPYGSCLLTLPNILYRSPAARSEPCPTPAARQRVLVDAQTGHLIEVIAGG